MYNLPYFTDNNTENWMNLIEEFPFAVLTGSFSNGKQVATQIPFIPVEKEGEMYIQGHIMKHTDHYNAFTENKQALVIFTGPDAYVSASWYKNPHQGSTWNYMSVQISGEVNFLSKNELKELMSKMTLKFENQNQNSPTIVENLDSDYIETMFDAIVGIELKLEQVHPIFKLSQNKDEYTYLTIIEKLNQLGENSKRIALEMKKRFSVIFDKNN
jgi:transcriptional regulator